MIVGESPGIGYPSGVGDSFVTSVKTYTTSSILVGSTGYYSMRVMLFRSPLLSYTPDVLVQKDIPISYEMGYSGLFPYRFLGMGLKLVSAGPSSQHDTVVNTLLHCWAEQVDRVWRTMETMSYSMKIDSASGSDLDDFWGVTYDLPRYYEESDEHYRLRLKNYTNVLTSGGTKPNCESVLDQLIGDTDSSEITTSGKAKVRITFNTDYGMRSARDKLTLLNNVIPKMLAAGVSYSIYIPFIDYYTDMLLKGMADCPYTVGMSAKVPDKTYAYVLNSIFVNRYTETYDMDALILNPFNFDYLLGMKLSKGFDKSYSEDAILSKGLDATFDLDGLFKKAVDLPVSMQYRLQKLNIDKSISIDIIGKMEHSRSYFPGITVVNQNIMIYNFDVILGYHRAFYNFDVILNHSWKAMNAFLSLAIRSTTTYGARMYLVG
jgi:hypothetical protein